MSPTPTALLGLGNLPRPSISAKPDSVIPWGMSVTFVCQGPLGVEVFLLEKDGKPDSFPDVMNSLVTETEARFPIGSVKKDTAGRYNCIYFVGNASSERSEFLELVVTGEAPSRADSHILSCLFPGPGSCSQLHHLSTDPLPSSGLFSHTLWFPLSLSTPVPSAFRHC
nr:leukocyte-associated immunoglobulin-like receptor 2 isoform X2 [Loxodonta africana]